VLVKVVKSYFLVPISLLLINITFNNKQFNNDVVIFYDSNANQLNAKAGKVTLKVTVITRYALKKLKVTSNEITK